MTSNTIQYASHFHCTTIHTQQHISAKVRKAHQQIPMTMRPETSRTFRGNTRMDWTTWLVLLQRAESNFVAQLISPATKQVRRHPDHKSLQLHQYHNEIVLHCCCDDRHNCFVIG